MRLMCNAVRAAVAFAAAIASFSVVCAATCPFDTGGSDAINDGVVLTRYALGITGSPLIASTRYASLDPLQVKNNIECVGCALDVNGDGQIDAVDTTIIARHLMGFQGASLTAGLALGSAPSSSRPDTASVVSFLANGCATGTAVPAGTVNQTLRYSAANTLAATDDFNVLADGGILATDATVNAAFAANVPTTGVIPATGAGARMMWYPARAAFRAGYVNGAQWDDGNVGIASSATGHFTTASGFISTAMGSDTTASGSYSTAMGVGTTASALAATAMGSSTVAGALASTAMGIAAIIDTNATGSFLYGDGSATVHNSAPRQFLVLATGATAFYSGTNSGNSNQSTWPGVVLFGGSGSWATLSDRAAKDTFEDVDTRSVLDRVVALPMTTWHYHDQDKLIRHMGPVAQDFRLAFKLGEDDRHISGVDADGVALAAIQGLNTKLDDALKAKDTQIAALREEINAQRAALTELAELKAQFVAFRREQQSSASPEAALSRNDALPAARTTRAANVVSGSVALITK